MPPGSNPGERTHDPHGPPRRSTARRWRMHETSAMRDLKAIRSTTLRYRIHRFPRPPERGAALCHRQRRPLARAKRRWLSAILRVRKRRCGELRFKRSSMAARARAISQSPASATRVARSATSPSTSCQRISSIRSVWRTPNSRSTYSRATRFATSILRVESRLFIATSSRSSPMRAAWRCRHRSSPMGGCSHGHIRGQGSDLGFHEQFSGCWCRIQGLSPFHDLMACCTRSNSHTVAARRGCTNIPHPAGGAQEAGTILSVGR
jgi:hypothetical protein